MAKLGDAFLFAVRNSHLWVVISNPTGAHGEFLIVNLTTLDQHIVDDSCVLQTADYPSFITRPTVVFYLDARLWQVSGDNGFIESRSRRTITPVETVSDKTLLKIQQGALKSDYFPPDFKAIVQNSLVVLPITTQTPLRR